MPGGGVMVTPRASNGGRPMRTGIDQLSPAELVELAETTPAEAFARALALIERARPAWHHGDLPCKSEPEVFTSGKPSDRSRAFTLCGACDHRETCLDFAIDLEDWTPAVVYGGADGPARRQIAKARQTEGVGSSGATVRDDHPALNVLPSESPLKRGPHDQ